MQTVEKKKRPYYLVCERRWVYHLLIIVAGYFGAFTYLLRGNVFCNAQTGNVVLMGLALGNGQWRSAVYYLIPISAYLLGAFVSELLAVVVLGVIPDSAPVQISQIMINFIASMQYNTFRQAEGVPMATTFATNHIRQLGIGLAKEILHRHSEDKSHRVKILRHFQMLIFFVLGAVVGTVFCNLLAGRAIWVTLLPLGIVFGAMLHADLTTEKNMVEKKPAGH